MNRPRWVWALVLTGMLVVPIAGAAVAETEGDESKAAETEGAQTESARTESARTEGADTTTTTVAGSEVEWSDEIPAHQLPVIEQLAEEHGVTVERAWAMLGEQNRLISFAETMRGKEGYAGFRVVWDASGVSGVLAVIDPSSVLVPEGLPVTVISARLEESDLEARSTRLTALLHDTGVDDVTGVTYEPFADEMIVWILRPVDSVQPATFESIEATVRQGLGPGFEDIAVRVEKSAIGYLF